MLGQEEVKQPQMMPYMPVQQQPSIIIQQQPVAVPVYDQNVENIAKAKFAVDWYAPKLKITSWILKIWGLTSIMSSVYFFFTAREFAQKKLHTQNATDVTHDEFAYYDSVRNVCVVAFLLACTQICMGRKGLMSVRSGTSRPKHHVFKKTVFGIFMICIYTGIASRICHGMHEISSKYNTHHESKNAEGTKNCGSFVMVLICLFYFAHLWFLRKVLFF